MGNGTVHRSSSYWEMGLEALDFKNYVAVNYTLIRKYGLHAAVLIGELASEARYYKREGKLDDGWFFSTVENIEEHTGLNAYYQRETLKTLQDTGIVEIKYSGLPRKRYFRVDAMRVIEEMGTYEETAGQQQSFTQSTTSGSPSEPIAVHQVDDNNCKEQPKQTTKKKERKKPIETYDSIIEGYTQDPDLRAAIFEFIKARKMMKAPMTNMALVKMLSKLDTLSDTTLGKIEILDQSIINGWKGVFPLKADSGKPRDTLPESERLTDLDWIPDLS